MEAQFVLKLNALLSYREVVVRFRDVGGRICPPRGPFL